MLKKFSFVIFLILLIDLSYFLSFYFDLRVLNLTYNFIGVLGLIYEAYIGKVYSGSKIITSNRIRNGIVGPIIE